MKPEQLLPTEYGLDAAFGANRTILKDILAETDTNVIDDIINSNEFTDYHRLQGSWMAMSGFADVLGGGSPEEHASAYRAFRFALETAGLVLPDPITIKLAEYMYELGCTNDPLASIVADYQNYLGPRQKIEEVICDNSPGIDVTGGQTLHVIEPILAMTYMLIERNIAETYYLNATRRPIEG
ncbi:hypothetical protein H7Y40_01640 [Pedobacter sp.]|nr:hypothetical protein [Candidatus Saccharibacteria bacterium]